MSCSDITDKRFVKFGKQQDKNMHLDASKQRFFNVYKNMTQWKYNDKDVLNIIKS